MHPITPHRIWGAGHMEQAVNAAQRQQHNTTVRGWLVVGWLRRHRSLPRPSAQADRPKHRHSTCLEVIALCVKAARGRLRGEVEGPPQQQWRHHSL